MRKMFYIDHGLDNYEEYVDLSEIIFARLVSTLPNGSDNEWVHTVEITFRNGLKEKITLSDFGRNKFFEGLMSKPRSRKTAPIEPPSCCPICGNELKIEIDEENETNLACISCDYKEFDPMVKSDNAQSKEKKT